MYMCTCTHAHTHTQSKVLLFGSIYFRQQFLQTKGTSTPIIAPQSANHLPYSKLILNYQSQCSNIDTQTPSAISISLAHAVHVPLSKVGPKQSKVRAVCMPSSVGNICMAGTFTGRKFDHSVSDHLSTTTYCRPGTSRNYT